MGEGAEGILGLHVPLFPFSIPLSSGTRRWGGREHLSRIKGRVSGICFHLGGSLRVTEWAVQLGRVPVEAEGCWFSHRGKGQGRDDGASPKGV